MTGSQWTCETCTLINPETRIQCEICLAPRQKIKSMKMTQRNIDTGHVHDVIDLSVEHDDTKVNSGKRSITSISSKGESVSQPGDKSNTKTVKKMKTSNHGASHDIRSFSNRDRTSQDVGQQISQQQSSKLSAGASGASVGFQCISGYSKWEKSQNILRSTFKIESLRNLQPVAVRHALDNKSCIIVMATGAGKSLCYQLPAATLDGLTLVISPLIALMRDQVAALNEKGIPAALLSSGNTAAENNAVMARLLTMSSPNGAKQTKTAEGASEQPPLKLLYCTPELIATDRFRSLLKSIHNNKQKRTGNNEKGASQQSLGQSRLSLFAFDEAHCLSTWGHDFRPAYRKLSWLRETFPEVPAMACTATATPKVIQDIRNCLHMSSEKLYPCFKSTFNRPNITYSVRYKDTLDAMSDTMGAISSGTTKSFAKGFQSAASMMRRKGNAKVSDVSGVRKGAAFGGGALGDMLSIICEQHSQAASRYEPCAGIIYVHKRDDTTKLAAQITGMTGIKAAPYHAGLKNDVRKQTQVDWTSGEVPIAVATVAFGMGIDVAHVRYVIHWSLAKSVEGFYQESGRAGRDGKPSLSVLYYTKDDASKFAFLIGKQEGAKQMKRQKKNEENGLPTSDLKMDQRSFDALQQMIEYCTKPGCRRQFLLNHFGENIVPAQTCRKTCDFCQNPKKIEASIESCNVMKQAASAASNYRRRGKGGPKKAEWDGQWAGPLGDNENDFNSRDVMSEWNDQDDSGLGIYKNFSAYDSFESSNSKISSKNKATGFVKASSVLDKYEAMEARESRRNGFSNNKRSENRNVAPPSIPEHLRASLPDPFLHQTKKAGVESDSAANQKAESAPTSSLAEKKAQLDDLRARMAELKAKKAAKLAAAKTS